MKHRTYYYLNRAQETVRVQPFYCGGYIHMVARPHYRKLKWKILNCYSYTKLFGYKRLLGQERILAQKVA